MSDNKAISVASREKFLSVWPAIRDELLAYLDANNMPKEARDWFKKVGYINFNLHLIILI